MEFFRVVFTIIRWHKKLSQVIEKYGLWKVPLNEHKAYSFFVVHRPYYLDNHGDLYVANQACAWKTSINWSTHEKLVLTKLKYFYVK